MHPEDFKVTHQGFVTLSILLLIAPEFLKKSIYLKLVHRNAFKDYPRKNKCDQANYVN